MTGALSTGMVGLLAGRKIVVDAGHGGHDGGAQGVTGLREKDANLDIAQRLRDDLKAQGASVIMTRDDDTFVSLQGRCDIANEADADIFVSVHNNAWTNPAKNGTEAYQAREASEASKALTRNISRHMDADLPTQGRGIFQAGFYVLRHTQMPAVLCEIAYVSNTGDEALLKTTEFREQAAQAIADGVVDYFQKTEQPASGEVLSLDPETEGYLLSKQ
ncbi:MAG: N-acetylmuramoyl-L-alanine amidase [Armatimonadetes bacterium]|nr:N-acetylmuramoyl-L-alanine amidase [Armatimonadota bacterium]